MKQTLAFITSDDFEDFTSQLIGQELPGFVAVEGSGGDGGLDGLEGTTAYQMYFPEPKNRDLAHYVTKINETLDKLQKTATSEGLVIDRWVLVVPEDLHFKAVIHLQRKSLELEIECIYWGATKLKALLANHPQIRDNFPEVFLPDVKQDLGDVKTGIARLYAPRTEYSVEIMTDEEHTKQKEALREDLRMLVRSKPFVDESAGANSGFRRELEEKFTTLAAKKAISDRAYEIDLEEINERYDDEVIAKKAELQQRGAIHSGSALQDVGKIDTRRYREIERLKMKYGKNIVYVNSSSF